ncbi:MAG: fatty acid desaturase family protein [Thermoflexibacteraceae bacterium]
MQTALSITDPVYQPKSHNFIDKWLIAMLNDERDLPFVYLWLKIICFVLPFPVYFYWADSFAWWLVAIYYVWQLAFFTGPYILMLHNTSHRAFFKKEYNFLNYVNTWVLGIFFGETPESYYAHHIGMHHIENNLPDDHSSTMKYQRDSFLHFLHYYFSFIILGISQLYQYLTLKKRFKIRNAFASGEFAFWVLCAGLCYLNLAATLATFVIPVFLTRFLMMAGNWGQHAFIDPQTPENNYRNSITCINSRYNQMCFNDGYHIGHHNRPAMHWTEMPVEFQKNVQKYAEEKALVFEKLDFFAVWLLLMLKRYDWLASFYVQLNPEKPLSKEQIIALMKERTKQFDVAW